MNDHARSRTDTSSPHALETSLKTHWRQLRTELAKDAIFFGATGMLIGLLHLYEFRLFGGEGNGTTLSDELLGDYFSEKALGFQMLGCMFMGGLIGLGRAFEPLRAILDGLYEHARMRLLQVASPMICMSVGIGLFSSAHAVRTGEGHGLGLAMMLLIFVALIVFASVLPALFDPRADDGSNRKNRWAMPLSAVALSLSGILLLVHATAAQSRNAIAASASHCDHVRTSTRL